MDSGNIADTVFSYKGSRLTYSGPKPSNAVKPKEVSTPIGENASFISSETLRKEKFNTRMTDLRFSQLYGSMGVESPDNYMLSIQFLKPGSCIFCLHNLDALVTS